ncbi:MAG: tetratricopeptide repeat protein [Sulfuricella sp.]|nr:tetratricopeptide repeat protein [Sulfuricella sp.]
MPLELNLRFPNPGQVIVRFGDNDPTTLPFVNPISDGEREKIAWYVETYGAHSLGDPDDAEARRIAAHLPVLGKALFHAVFADREAARYFNEFQDAEGHQRLITVSAEHPAILALPWELLHDSRAPDGTYLFHETLSIRRRVAGAGGGRKPFAYSAKPSLHLLFVVSRPAGSGFLDPRSDALPVLDALDEHAPGRVTWEFLRPATFDALIRRLDDKTLPCVDILHFDGHGVFDERGGLPERHKKNRPSYAGRGEAIMRDAGNPGNPGEPDSPPHTGYLLFEDGDGNSDFVSAHKLGENLHRRQIALVILSACQTAAHGDMDADGEERGALGDVAARLTATGIPAVLAMTHSVLVHTTRDLFGEFYRQLALHRPVGAALDAARRHLANHPEKYPVQRGAERVWLKLHDWFIPALYQHGVDGPLLEEGAVAQMPLAPLGNLPERPESGFYGRTRELWDIERWFAGAARRVTLTGFGGQGKTALALEAGRWLTRTGMFRAAVFVDYSRLQAADAVAVAINEIAAVLGLSLIDAAAATAALWETPTLVILDNLEALSAETLKALLDAAVPWSQAGGSRLLCTTRRPDFNHPDYRNEGSLVHRSLLLKGLGLADALEWSAKLFRLPPAATAIPSRDALAALFEKVAYHPLTLRVLVQQIKTRRIAEVGQRLEQLLAGAGNSSVGGDTPASLVASLQLSLDRLDREARALLPRLGVFQGGAMEDSLLEVTGLGENTERHQLESLLCDLESGNTQAVLKALGVPAGVEIPADKQAEIDALLTRMKDELREKLAELPPPRPDLWPALRRQLEDAALLAAENLEDVSVPHLRFHPTLAPMLWAELDDAQRAELSDKYRQRYYQVANYLYHEDTRHPHQARAIARREMPNLLHAVYGALTAGEAEAVEFAESVGKFLNNFGLKREAEQLAELARSSASTVGSQPWFLAQSNHGEQLLAAGQVAEAAKVFSTILVQLGEADSIGQAVTLDRLGRCQESAGRPDWAEATYRQGLAVCARLERDDSVQRTQANLSTDLADVLRHMGRYGEARALYESTLEIDQALGNVRGLGVTHGQLGNLALVENRLDEAARRHQAALLLFRQLGEPAVEAQALHQLGVVYQRAGQYEAAEQHYRASARIKEGLGDLAGAAKTWNQLAIISQAMGKAEAAEAWFRKAMDIQRLTSQPLELANTLNNLAALLRDQPARLVEARDLVWEALTIKKTLDPGRAEIWKSYTLLAGIARHEAVAAPTHRTSLEAEAEGWRQRARSAWRAFPGSRTALRQHSDLILTAVGACAAHPEASRQFGEHQAALRQAAPEWAKLADALDCLLAGERAAEALCRGQDYLPAHILETILQGLADLDGLADLLPQSDEEDAATS